MVWGLRRDKQLGSGFIKVRRCDSESEVVRLLGVAPHVHWSQLPPVIQKYSGGKPIQKFGNRTLRHALVRWPVVPCGSGPWQSVLLRPIPFNLHLALELRRALAHSPEANARPYVRFEKDRCSRSRRSIQSASLICRARESLPTTASITLLLAFTADRRF